MIELALDLMMDVDKVMKKNPKLSKAEAKEIVISTKKASEKYGVPYHIYLSILAVESGFDITKISYTNDIGMSQISPHNVIHMGLSTEYLRTNLQYSIEAGAKILGTIKKSFPKSYIARYNCGWRKWCEKTRASKRYVQLVSSFYGG